MIGTAAEPIDTTTRPVSRRGILVVDDEPAILKLLDLALSRHGFAVWRADDAASAIDLYRAHAPAINLVLLDVRMPGQDGPQILKALRGINPAVRCCFMSGNTGRYDLDELLALGAIRVLGKPFDLAEIAATMDQLTSVSLP